MSDKVKTKLTVLIDNTASNEALEAEHGLSIWLTRNDTNILFDTGQSGAFIRNADKLGIDLNKAAAVVFSHGHYDHTGGFQYLPRLDAHIYLHPEAFIKRYSCHIGMFAKDVSMPEGSRQAIEEYMRLGKCVYTAKPVCIQKGISASGQIPRVNEFEDTGGNFYKDKKKASVDAIWDDQMIWIDSPKGLVIVSGCAHSGIVNVLDYTAKTTGKKIWAVIGGLHLRASSRQRMQQTFEAFKHHKIEVIAPMHCTGAKQIQAIKRAFPNEFIALGAGSEFTF